MSWSMGEIRSLSQKAAKGCGLPWGLAEEAGFAVEWLEARNAPGVAALAVYLKETDVEADYSMAYCPIGNGAWISDTNNLIGNFPITVKQPLLLAPFVASTLEKRAVSLNWAENSILLNADNLGHTDAGNVLVKGSFECKSTIVQAEVEAAEKLTRVPDARGKYVEQLEAFAARTYAPATEQSRMAGAGAGISDND